MSLSNSEKLALFSSLGNMLTSGIALLDALDSLKLENNKHRAKVLEGLYSSIEAGNTLADSLALFPDTFDQTIIAVIRGAEEAGTLEQTLKDVVITLEKQIEFEDKLKEALTYPIFIFVVFGGVVLMMLLFVIPRIANIFERLRVPIPTATQFLVNISHLLLNYPLPVLMISAACIALLVYLVKMQRRALVGFIFSLPLISGLGRSIDLTRYFRSVALLLTAGIPITQALEFAQHVLTQRNLKEALQESQEIVLSGNTFSQGLESSKDLINPLAIRMIAGGEKSGTLETSAQQASDFFEKQVNKNVKRLTVLLEPIMILVIGLLIGGMMLTIIAPIYGLVGKIGGS